MDLEIRHLRLVTAVADCGSLTRAGNRLHLTPAGERLLLSARDVLDRLDRTEDEIRQMGKDRAGILRITTECYTCYHWLPPLLVHYRKRFPRVEVRIDVGATGRPLDRLLAGKIGRASCRERV